MLSKSPIKEFAKVGAGQGAPQKETDFSGDGYPFIRAGHLENLLDGMKELDLPKVNSTVAKRYKLKLYQPNTIVFAKSGMSAMKGRIYKLKNPCYVVNHLATLKLGKNAFPDFVVYTLRYFSPVRLISPSSYPSLKQSTIENYEIPFLKSYSDQIQIADILRKAETLISQRKQSITLLNEFLKSTFLEMFGDPSTNKMNFPKGIIRDVICEAKYGTSNPAEDLGQFPYLRMNNITSEGYMDYSKLKYINISKEDFEKYVVRKGDLLFNRTNSKELVGKTGVFDKETEMVIAGYLIRVRTNEKANPWYLWGYLNSLHGKQTLFGMCKSIVGMANINAQELQGIRILIPPIELQNRFANIVENTESLKAQYQSSLREFENLYGSLSQKAFRGELTLLMPESQESMAAEANTKYEVGNGAGIQPRICNSPEKAILAGHIIYQTNNEHFGRVKFQKLLHLTSYFCKIDIESNFTKKAAGPHDGHLIADIESTLSRFQFYDIKQSNLGNHRVNYTPLSAVSDLEDIYKGKFEAEKERIDSFLEKFKKSSWEQCEIVSTLYAVWNNRIIKNEDVLDDALKQDFLNWDAQKVKYKDRLDKALQWMRDEGVIPDGWGKLIE